MKPISQDEILEAMQSAMAKDATRSTEIPAVSVTELMAATGKGQDVVRQWLRRGIVDGKVEVVKVKRMALDARLSTIRAYRLLDSRPPARNGPRRDKRP